MAGINGINNYYSLFTSPVSTTSVNPVTNLIYGAAASKAYSQSVAKKAQSELSSYLSSMNSVMNGLKASSKPITTNGPNSTFDKRTVTANDDGISGTAAYNATQKDYTFNVTALAKSQSNTGASLNSNDKSFTEGLNTLSIKVGANSTKNISFTFDENDTNKSAFGKMASAINSARVGVTAKVFNDDKTGKSYLSISSNKTGTDNGFTISDVTGNSVAASGAANTATSAQNAELSIDGKQYTSQENSIKLDNSKVQVSFSKADGKDIKVSVGTDVKGIAEDIKDMADSYNKARNAISAYTSKFGGASKLEKELGNVVKSHRSSLQSIGIDADSNGTLKINDKKLEEALSSSPSKVKDTLGGYNGIASRLIDKSNQFLSSPTSYIKPNEGFIASAGITGGLTQTKYSNVRNYNAGLLLDTFL